MLREKIFKEIRRLKIGEGGVWMFNQCNIFANDSLTPREKKEFITEMNDLINKGIFTNATDTPIHGYRLTQYGEEVIYRDEE